MSNYLRICPLSRKDFNDQSFKETKIIIIAPDCVYPIIGKESWHEFRNICDGSLIDDELSYDFLDISELTDDLQIELKERVFQGDSIISVEELYNILTNKDLKFTSQLKQGDFTRGALLKNENKFSEGGVTREILDSLAPEILKLFLDYPEASIKVLKLCPTITDSKDEDSDNLRSILYLYNWGAVEELITSGATLEKLINLEKATLISLLHSGLEVNVAKQCNVNFDTLIDLNTKHDIIRKLNKVSINRKNSIRTALDQLCNTAKIGFEELMKLDDKKLTLFLDLHHVVTKLLDNGVKYNELKDLDLKKLDMILKYCIYADIEEIIGYCTTFDDFIKAICNDEIRILFRYHYNSVVAAMECGASIDDLIEIDVRVLTVNPQGVKDIVKAGIITFDDFVKKDASKLQILLKNPQGVIDMVNAGIVTFDELVKKDASKLQILLKNPQGVIEIVNAGIVTFDELVKKDARKLEILLKNPQGVKDIEKYSSLRFFDYHDPHKEKNNCPPQDKFEKKEPEVTNQK